MATQKTLPTTEKPADFLRKQSATAQDAKDLLQLMKWMQEVSGFPPVMWGEAIVGYGLYQYEYASKHAGKAPLVAFSPRKAGISLYVMAGLPANQPLVLQMKKVKAAKSCLQVKKVQDIDFALLEKMVHHCIHHLQETFPQGKV